MIISKSKRLGDQIVKKYQWLLLLVVCSFSYAASSKVTFIIPDKEGPIFWQLVSEISQASANNLNIELNVINSDSNRFALKSTIEDIINSEHKPDFLIFRPFLGNTEVIFKQLEHANIPFVTLEQAFRGESKAVLGNPQEKYKYWLGQINYDNKAGGKLLLDALVNAHQARHPKQTVHIVGIGGDFDEVSTDRQYALEQIKPANSKDIYIEQIFPMYWNPLMIKERLPLIEKRYPKTNVYWCAGDQMALELLRLHQLTSSTPLIIGGFDWLPQALEKIETGELTASVGGHIFMVTSALLKILDYQQGINHFSSPNSLNQYEVINQENVKKFKTFFNEKQWQQVDFTQFLLSNNPNAKVLNVENMLAQLAQQTTTK